MPEILRSVIVKIQQQNSPMGTHKNKITNTNLHANSMSMMLALLLIVMCSCAPAEPTVKTPNMKVEASLDSPSGITSAPPVVATDNKNTNSISFANFRQSLRQQLRKKLINSLSFGINPASPTTASPPAANPKPTVVLSETTTPSVVITTSPNNAPPKPETTTLLPVPPTPQPVPTPPPVALPQNPPQGNLAELAKRQQDIIQQVKVQIAQQSLSTKIETIFSRLPQSSELDSIILTADLFALVKTVQQTSQSTLSCEQKVSYLSDFFGRMQTAVRMKNYTLANLNVVMEGAKAEIKRLNQQIARSNDEITSLGLDDLKRRLNQGLLQLSTAYRNYNQADSLIDPKKNAIAKSQATIEDYKRKIDSGRSQIPIKKLQLSQINSNISLLEQQLADAKVKKSIAETYISSLEASLKTLEQKLVDEKNSEAIMESELSRIYDESDRSKSKYKVLEVDVQRFRTEIAQKSQKQSDIQAAIAKLQARVSAQTKKFDPNEQSKIQNFIKDLRSVLPSVQIKIDEINYRCNEVKQIQPISLKSGEMILFLITPRDFSAYIQASYQIKQDLSNVKPIKISLISANILDRAWQEQLGNPYSSSSYYQSSQFTFNGDFNCLAPSELESGNGTITKVGKKSIEIATQRMRYILNLGACSRIQSPQQIPQVGQKLYFRGRKVQQGEYNAYKVSCF